MNTIVLLETKVNDLGKYLSLFMVPLLAVTLGLSLAEYMACFWCDSSSVSFHFLNYVNN